MCFSTGVNTGGESEIAKQQLQQMQITAQQEDQRYKDAQAQIVQQKADQDAAQAKSDADTQAKIAADQQTQAQAAQQTAAQNATGASAVTSPTMPASTSPQAGLGLAAINNGLPTLQTLTQKAAQARAQQSQPNMVNSPTLLQSAFT